MPFNMKIVSLSTTFIVCLIGTVLVVIYFRGKRTESAWSNAAKSPDNPNFTLIIGRSCDSLYAKAIDRAVRSSAVHAELRSIPDGQVLASFELSRSDGIVDPPIDPDHGWKLIPFPKSNQLSLMAYKVNDNGVVDYASALELLPSPEISQLPAPIWKRSVDLDSVIADGKYELRSRGLIRWLFLGFPKFGQVWPQEIGFGASVEGVDDFGHVRFRFLTGKSAGRADVCELIQLTDFASAEDCDAVSFLRIKTDHCVSSLSQMNGRAAWDGTVLIKVGPPKESWDGEAENFGHSFFDRPLKGQVVSSPR